MTFSKALYFAALIPPEHVKEEVLQLKLEIKEKYNASHALKLPAHITILPPFWLENNQESELLTLLDKKAQHQTNFLIKLKDFGHFGQRVIYVDVLEQEPVKKLNDLFTSDMEMLVYNLSAAFFHPHITLASRDLTPENFHFAWKEFKMRRFTNSFQVNAIFLLKHNGKIWEILKDFPFERDLLAGN